MVESEPSKTSGWRNVLDSNPVVVLAVAVVAGAGVVATAMTYFNSGKIDRLEIEHKTELAELKNKSGRELLESTQPLKEKLQDLNFRVSSIERRLPGSGPSYLDVSTVTIGPEARNSLDSKYTSFENDGFFVAVPKGEGWVFRMSNELEYLKSMYNLMGRASDWPEFEAIASKTPTFVWENNTQVIEIRAKMDGDEFTFAFRPTVSVMHVDQRLLGERAELLLHLYDAELTAEKTQPLPSGAQIDKSIKDGKEADSTGAPPDKITDVAAQVTQPVIKAVEAKHSAVEMLEKHKRNQQLHFY